MDEGLKVDDGKEEYETEEDVDPDYTSEISNNVAFVNENYKNEIMKTFFETRQGMKNRANEIVGMKKEELAHLRLTQRKEQERLKEKIAIRDFYLKNFKGLTFRLADEISRVRDKEKYKFLCRKILSHWKEYTEEQKHKKRMNRMARRHFENRLKRMIMFKWYIYVVKMKQLNNINVWEDKINQRIGNLKDEYGLVLHEKIEELNRVQDLLNVELKEKEALQNNLKKALMRGVCAMNNKFLEILKEEEDMDLQMTQNDIEESQNDEVLAESFQPVKLQTGLGFEPTPRKVYPQPHPQQVYPSGASRLTSFARTGQTMVHVQRASKPDSRVKPKTKRPRKRIKGFQAY